MNFVQFEFIVFFTVVFALYWALPRAVAPLGLSGRRAQNALLAVASAIFYGWVHPWFLWLLYGSAVLDFAMGLAMQKWPDRKKWFLAASLAGNLGLLGTFKYLDFLIENWIALFDALGLQTNAHTLGIFLPVGISFYTFQTMSYTIDIYRGRLKPRTNFLDYVVFISFFPQLVAGPVERASHLLPQMERDRVWSLERFQSGLGLALFGLFKKVAIADAVAPYVDKVFSLTDPSFGLIWAGSVGFTLQILADFSGYTDIARGTARMLGFELIENFRHPYLSTSPNDFWARWHMSFSTWIRDYVYFPLQGKGRGWLNRTWALMMAMVLSGVWHGAAWNFIVWGAYFGVIAVLYRDLGPYVPAALKGRWWSRPAAIALMYLLVLVAMLMFRAGPMDIVWRDLTLNPLDDTPAEWAAAAAMMGVFLGCAAPLWLAMASEKWLRPRLAGSPWRLPVRTTMWTLYALAAMSFVRVTAEDFIYFQF